MYECARCHNVIRDQHVIACDDRFWHENCLECALCHARPQSCDASMFALNDALLCREDYLRVRHTCLVCKRELSAADARVALCQRFRRFVHVTCLQCSICNARLQLGDQFKMISMGDQSSQCSRVVCAHHHSNSDQTMSITSANASSMTMSMSSHVNVQSLPQSQSQPQQPMQTSSGGGRGGGGGAKRGRKSRLNANSLV